jgi:hypothetical protein
LILLDFYFIFSLRFIFLIYFRSFTFPLRLGKLCPHHPAMHALSHARSLVWAALMSGLMTRMGEAAGVVYPGIFEVDALFPRNETYTPQTLMPIVFAVQNPSLAAPLEASITWDLWEGNNYSSPGSVAGGALDIYLGDYPSNETSLEYRIINTISYPEGFWTLYWNLQINNCSEFVNTTAQYTNVNGTTVFTVSKSGQTPDLVAATSPDMCVTADSYAFNVDPLGEDCAVFGSTTTANPCSATINPSAASSIYASATAAACEPGRQNPNVTCPTFPSKSSASSSNFDGQFLIAAASALLTMLATMIYL